MDKTMVMSAELLYEAASVQLHEIDDATIALRVFGQGPALVLIHGYPVSGYTWRKLLAKLSYRFTCYVIDLPGLGDSDWQAKTDFSFTAQARRLDLLFHKLHLHDFAIIAHDTGATLARLVALSQPVNVRKLVIINTEIPGHRPPWISFYQFLAKLPLFHIIFKLFMKSRLLTRSSMGLGQFYSDRKLLSVAGYIDPYVEPLATNSRRIIGALNYLKGIEWEVVDGFKEQHKNIRAKVLFVWGEDDKTFPVHLAEEMCDQFQSKPVFVRIASAALMPQEEQPEEVLKNIMPFLLEENINDQTEVVMDFDSNHAGIKSL